MYKRHWKSIAPRFFFSHLPRAVTGLGLAVGFAPSLSNAATYTSRITLGAYMAAESFAPSQALDGQTANDFLVISSRFFLRGQDVGPEHLELIGDIRDKNDFFEKLNKELLQLDNNNTLQIRQLAVKLPNARIGYYGTAGRFPLPEAGAVNVDGIEAGYRWNPNLRTSVFGGLNPKRPDQTYLQFNSDSQTFGTYTLYQPKAENWGSYFYSTSAAVGQTVQGHLDRAYLFNNTVFQWRDPDQISVLVYGDMTPRLYFQNLSVSYVQEIIPSLTSTANLLAVDVIEYSRRQGLLETLQPSAYKEANLSLRQKINRNMSMQYYGAWGLRDVDNLSKQEFSFGPTFNQIWDQHFSGGGTLGIRNNFSASENFLRLNIGYYSKAWEVTFDQEFGVHTEPNLNTYHPMTTELGVAHYFSRELYSTISLQRAADENVEILSTFFRLGYRFGTEAVSPLRDGAPPRGKI